MQIEKMFIIQQSKYHKIDLRRQLITPNCVAEAEKVNAVLLVMAQRTILSSFKITMLHISAPYTLGHTIIPK